MFCALIAPPAPPSASSCQTQAANGCVLAAEVSRAVSVGALLIVTTGVSQTAVPAVSRRETCTGMGCGELPLAHENNAPPSASASTPSPDCSVGDCATSTMPSSPHSRVPVASMRCAFTPIWLCVVASATCQIA